MNYIYNTPNPKLPESIFFSMVFKMKLTSPLGGL